MPLLVGEYVLLVGEYVVVVHAGRKRVCAGISYPAPGNDRHEVSLPCLVEHGTFLRCSEPHCHNSSPTTCPTNSLLHTPLLFEIEPTLPLMPFVPARGVMRQRRACHRDPSLGKRVVLLILSSPEYPLCFELNLPDPLLRNIQLFTELCERSRFTVVQPVPSHQYILGSLR
jgi:hypothetical protein